MQKPTTPRKAAPAAEQGEIPFSSNEVRLSPCQWVIALIILVAVFHFLPVLWEGVEKLDPGPDYRIPYSLGDDYWVYDRYCRRVCAGDKTLVIGDSVIWGHYVAKDQTLSHWLNELAGDRQFANLSVDGIHPAAMGGLVEYYGREIRAKKVILNCNLLWISSKRHDLSGKKEFSFNHPKLVPQFFPRIPCYREPPSGRIAVVIGRRVPFFAWADHLRIAYFDNTDIYSWTMEHPYDNPAGAVTLELPSPDELPSPRPVAKPWTEKTIPKFSPSWVELEASLQWHCFKRTVEILQSRENRVFVLVGPFNEHMLKEESLRMYTERKNQVKAWLKQKGIPCYVPPALPSNVYADASHPLGDGYAILAGELLEQQAFVEFLESNGSGGGQTD